jgi:hypothetical protein
MRKALITLVMLGSLSTAALAQGVKINGDFGYRFDSVEQGTAPKSKNDRIAAELVLTAPVNNKVNVVVGASTGTFNSEYADMGGNASLKDFGLHLAYVEYAAMDRVKVRLGKMHQPWAGSSSLFFDRDIKPEGLAVAFAHKSGLFANASSLKIVEGGANDDAKVQSLQVGLKKEVGPLSLTGAAALHNHRNVVGADVNLQQAFGEVGTKFAGLPVTAFVDFMRNDKANADNQALAYGVKVAKGKWDVSAFHQKVEANAQYGLWHDTDFSGAVGNHKGHGLTAGYKVAKGWKVNAKYFDVERGANKESYKRLLVDLNYMF